ncbi:hypothetical protein BC834DRAFT_845777 [Gloeopeniophorella convolvens]|nr:hypothetical protein BC834DRAFT_845777 [Gloeopeniophorella convolvens]
MELYFFRSKLLNTVLYDGSAKPVYRTETPHRAFKARVTTIFRSPANQAAQRSPRMWGSTGTRSPNMSRVHGEESVAQIEWHEYRQSVFVLRGESRRLKQYMPKESLLRSRRAFIASNGQSYVWSTGAFSTKWKLKRNDGSGVVVARSHDRSYGFVKQAHDAYLELTAEAVPLMDEIVMTFLWVERRRRDQEKANSTAG